MPLFFCLLCRFIWLTNIILFSSSVRAIVALNLHSYGSGRNPWGNLKPNYLEKVSSHGSALCSLSALSGTYYLIFICYNDAWKCICCAQMAPPSFWKESMLSFCFFIDFFYKFFMKFFYYFSLEHKCLLLFFCFSTTWSFLLCICKYVLQSNVKLMVPWWKYTF